jgi:hypothetical protein
MKLLLAILFSVTLVWAQCVPAACAEAAPAAAGGSGCSCCHCGSADCCMGKTTQRPQPMPAAPAPRGSQSSHLLLVAPAALAFLLPQAPDLTFSPEAPAHPRAAALPLYQQNCTFLI